MVGVGRDLCGSSSPTTLPKQGRLQQAAQDLVHRFPQDAVTARKEKRRRREKRHFLPDPKASILPFSFLHLSLSLLLSLRMDLGAKVIDVVSGLRGKISVMRGGGRERKEGWLLREDTRSCSHVG